MRRTDAELITRAFLDAREGMSFDYVVAAPEANARFLARARKLGVGGSDFDANHWLLNARKAGKLKGEPTETEYRLPEKS